MSNETSDDIPRPDPRLAQFAIKQPPEKQHANDDAHGQPVSDDEFSDFEAELNGVLGEYIGERAQPQPPQTFPAYDSAAIAARAKAEMEAALGDRLKTFNNLVEDAAAGEKNCRLSDLRQMFVRAIEAGLRRSPSYLGDFFTALTKSTGHSPRRLEAAFKEVERDHRGAAGEGVTPIGSVEQGLGWFNTHMYAIRDYGGTMVIKNKDGTGSFFTRDKFVVAYGDRIAFNEEGKPVAVASAWLSHDLSKHNRYTLERFEPQPPGVEFSKVIPRADGDNDLNIWRGYQPAIIPANPCLSLDQQCPMIHEYLFNVIAAGDRDVFQYILRWETDAVVNPRRLAGRTALYFWDPLGRTGKNMFFNMNVAIFGKEQCFGSARQKVMDGDFTEQFANKYFTCQDEAPTVAQSGREATDAAKRGAFLWSLIDDPTLDLEPKGVGMRQVVNFGRRMIATNRAFAVSGGGGSDRIFATEVSAVHRNDHKFYGALQGIFDAFRTGGEMDRFFSLMVSARDHAWIREFHPQVHKPITATMDAQRERSLAGFPNMLKLLLDRGELPFTETGERMDAAELDPQLRDVGHVPAHFVQSHIMRACINNLPGIKIDNVDDTAFGRNVMTAFAWCGRDEKEKRRLKRFGRDSFEGRRWPPLWVCRRLWELKYFGGRPYDWATIEDGNGGILDRPDWKVPTSAVVVLRR
ncbi:hypothetical protein DPM33_23620 [Mesorhizobium hawassense]|uniref:NrS-1 polymerase-like helicase domain-containing protein n=1 Tax=Mesorhizobium hawassense TaxID=1209954 RepID=A0A330HV03_9HYPH|nr:primase-helicase family protein [Mesorhizobium hawassense]RAZ88517.1 hypothetical protein DPM33_23620 [Mesorhizobium hawassense]